MNVRLLLRILALLILPPPPAGAAQNYPPAVTNLVAKAKARIKTIDMAGLKSCLDSKSAGLLIDVREPDEFAYGHLPGAINIPRGQVELRIWPQVGYPGHIDLQKRITLYCSSGTRSILAARSLQELGFRNVVAVDMRIEDWGRARYPVISE